MECGEIEENDNEDSFIEIEVDPWSSNEVDDDEKDKNNNNNNNLKVIEESNNGEFELLRISISSTINPIIPLPLLHHHHHTNTSSIVDHHHSHPKTCAFHVPPSSSPPSSLVNCTTNSSSPPLNNYHSGLINQPTLLLNAYGNNMDLRYSTSTTRKEGSMRRRNGSGMMKLLIKCRVIKLGTLLASLVKPRGTSQDKKATISRSKSRPNILQCYDKTMVIDPHETRKTKHYYLDLDNNINTNKRSKSSSSSSSSSCSSVVEIDLSALSLRGIFSSSSSGHHKKRSSKSKSCSTSCDTSPIHQGFSLTSGDHNTNIQAAIAYCKTSLGQTTSDFSF